MNIPGIAVIGSGYWGKNLVRNFNELGALKLICDQNKDILSLFETQYPKTDTSIGLSSALDRDDIEGVVIATPAETHYGLAKEALLAGKHVYVEKPLVLKADHADELIAIARQKKRILMVGHLLQYHPAFVLLKKMVTSGELGRINYIYSNRLNLGKIRREENALWSFAPHDISMILALAGEEPSSILATGGNYLHKSIADVTTTHLEFSSGLKAHIFVSWLHPFKEQKLVVVGDKKMAVFDDTKPWNEKLVLYPHTINWQDNVPVPDKACAETVALDEAEPLKLECQHFLQAIRSGKDPLTNGEEGAAVLRTLNAAQRSLDANGSKVTLTEAKDVSSTFIHGSSYVDEEVSIGEGTAIWHFSHILQGSDIGENCKIGQNASIGPNVRIGNNCKIQNNVSIYKGVTLEDDVFCGPSMVFTNVYNPRCEIPRMNDLRETLIRHGATLGANCTIVCGNTIGAYAFIGAGAVVTRNVPNHALMVGSPAVQKGWVCQCGVKLDANQNCPDCGKTYVLEGSSLKRQV